MNGQELSTETIKQRIREEALRRQTSLSGRRTGRGMEGVGDPHSFAGSTANGAGEETVPVDALLSGSDVDFIRNVYRTLLKREPDPQGLADWLFGLKGDRFDRIDVLRGISRSEEGRQKGVKIKGLALRYWVNRYYRVPGIGYFIRILAAVFNLPKIMINFRNYQAATDARLAGKADRDEMDRLRTVLAGKADRSALESVKATGQEMTRQIAEHRLNILDQERRMRFLLEEVKKSLPEPLSLEQGRSVVKETDHMLDALYMAFEDRFRGSRTEVKQKLSVYLPYVADRAAGKKEITILDVGCGRGEWLELLRENGYTAKGIDINKVALQQCGELGLDVAEADVIEYLSGLQRESLGVITGFHIIEHLEFNRLIALFDESLAVLKSGGMIIFETPNPANLLVSMYDFYRDPSHLRPLHPDTVSYLVGSRGFLNAGSYFVSSEGTAFKLIPSTEWKLDDINDYIRAPRDFALIGYKP